MQADIAQSGRTQQGVAYGMHQNICIRMPQQPLLIGNVSTAQHQFSPRHQPVDIITYSASH